MSVAPMAMYSPDVCSASHRHVTTCIIALLYQNIVSEPASAASAASVSQLLNWKGSKSMRTVKCWPNVLLSRLTFSNKICVFPASRPVRAALSTGCILAAISARSSLVDVTRQSQGRLMCVNQMQDTVSNTSSLSIKAQPHGVPSPAEPQAVNNLSSQLAVHYRGIREIFCG